MAVDERGAGITLMEQLLPPVGWADVATKHDLVGLGTRLDGRLDALEVRLDRLEACFDDLSRDLRAQTWRLVTLMVAVVGVVVAAVRL